MNLRQVYHTVRWLKREQIVGQFRVRWQRFVGPPARDARLAGPLRLRSVAIQDIPAPCGADTDVTGIPSGRFVFVGQSAEIGFPPDFSAAGPSKLWAYNLHYFDYLHDLPYDVGRRLVEHWIDTHSQRPGSTGWEPYPTSLRLLNWCGYYFHTNRERMLADPEFAGRVWRSIWQQADWLSGRLETHLLGNHLLENLAALCFVGATFSGRDPAKWRAIGLRLLRREVTEQLLPDGMHFERSPMYHARVVYVLALLLSTDDPEIARLIQTPFARAYEVLHKLCLPDGQLALLNDSALDVYTLRANLFRGVRSKAGVLEWGSSGGSFALPHAGYFGCRSESGDYIVCDAGPIGPDYLPGHAHGDMLSFELAFDGRRIVTDSGVHGYGGSPLRAWCRSTAAHNTVEVNGQDQCEFWGDFRVARRGRVHDVRWCPLEDGFVLSAEHDGYRRLPCDVVHRRLFRWHRSGILMARDELRGVVPFDAVSRLHLHPSCEVDRTSETTLRVTRDGTVAWVCFAGGGRLELERTPYCPRFGQAEERITLAWRLMPRVSHQVAALAVVKGGERPPTLSLITGVERGRHAFGWS